MKKYRITIATPSFPPHIGGSALYAEIFSRLWSLKGHNVRCVSFQKLQKIPTGLRHIVYIVLLIPSVIYTDAVVALDTFSVALPAVLIGKLFHKKVVVRVGGDFLWETYLNRTKEKIFLSDFYTPSRRFTYKERIIYTLTDMMFRYADTIVFSTEWQKHIYEKAYTLDMSKVSVVENAYPVRSRRNIVPKNRTILSPSRNIFLKNKQGLQEAFDIVKERFFDVELDTRISTHTELLQRMSNAYMVVIPSFSEVSPNMLLDAVSLGVPVVATKDCGIKDRFSDVVVWVDPTNPQDIASGIELLMDAKMYSEYMARMSKHTYTRSEDEVAEEFLLRIYT